MFSNSGTTDAAHSALSKLPEQGRQDDIGIVRDQSKLIAFYLPQFHRVPENSEWWGPGFTEWTNVAKGAPNFEGHYQPHIPRDFGFYDLSNVEVMREQAEYARLYGITGFCFYYYWFSGRRILEKPLDNFLKSDIPINFCFCWANENWTRTWDGENDNVLLAQKYADGDEERLIQSLADAFNDPRYIYVDKKPMFLVYRAQQMPNPAASIARWRAEAQRLGFPGLHVVAVDFYDISDPGEVGADALVEFPPHKYLDQQNHPDIIPAFSNPNFAGGVADYPKIVLQSALRPKPNFTLYRGIIPSWDNTARRQNNPMILLNATPALYGAWLKYIRSYTRLNHPSSEDNFIFINAWNEWGEGCHLEPDIHWGLAYLEETLRSAFFDGAEYAAFKQKEDYLAAVREALIKQLPATKVEEPVDADSNHRDQDEPINSSTISTSEPANGIVRQIAFRLSGRPLLYNTARRTYKAFARLFR